MYCTYYVYDLLSDTANFHPLRREKAFSFQSQVYLISYKSNTNKT